jgi:dTDP-4-amino-4,6-dideoxygalactose transaminase
MYIVGQEEIDAIARVIRDGSLFRYGIGGECDRFEQRYADYLGSGHVALTASGTFALTAAVSALGIGPGDEVLVPAHTYMATAMAVLAAGAIPVIVDVDESITIDPQAVEDAIGPRTRAVIPVHMWGAACNMEAIMEIAARHDLLGLGDTCLGFGGG